MLAELDQTGESQIDLGRLLVRVAAPPRAAEGLGRLPVRVAVAGAAVGAAATSAYTAYPPPYYRPPCGPLRQSLAHAPCRNGPVAHAATPGTRAWRSAEEQPTNRLSRFGTDRVFCCGREHFAGVHLDPTGPSSNGLSKQRVGAKEFLRSL